jgi:general secretion pathway protein G
MACGSSPASGATPAILDELRVPAGERRRGICLAEGTCVTAIATYKSRAHSRGVTRFELCVVTAGVALISVIGLLIIRPRVAAAESDAAVKDASRILVAAQEWRRENGKGCPTLSQLVHERQLDRAARMDDPWGERYRVRCTDEEVSVVSPGEDHQPNTSDDIRVPRSTS